MTYDPYQTYATLGGYSGIGNPFQTPFNAIQNPALNSAAAWNPFTGYQPQTHWQGVSPHSLVQQLAAQQLAQQIVAQQLAAQQIAAQQNPFGQPFGLQPALLNQQGPMQPQLGQIGFGGQGNPFGVPLAPQSWVGQGGQFGPGQTNPVLLAQLTARALQAQGITPGVGYQG